MGGNHKNATLGQTVTGVICAGWYRQEIEISYVENGIPDTCVLPVPFDTGPG